jgi:hypothetical protein
MGFFAVIFRWLELSALSNLGEHLFTQIYSNTLKYMKYTQILVMGIGKKFIIDDRAIVIN